MAVYWKSALFILASLAIAWFSRRSLRNSQVHGFYRFFAFEDDLGLVLLNLTKWFDHPFSVWQIISWLLLIASGFLALHGFYLLRRVGQPQGSFENTTRLVIVGAYRFIRHPLYASLFFLAWGVFFKLPSLPGLSLASVASGFLFATARVEEGENLNKFGTAYADYMKKSSMFVPFLF